jgi:FKBP-type peptidyl-prolyl cis-trans isomerase
MMAANEEAQKFLQARQQEQQQASQQQSQGNLEQGQAFLKENASKEGVMATMTGLQYEILEEGEGDKPAATDTVKVHYTGRLLNGTVFDSSVERGEPVEFPLNQVIPGWTEGLQLMSPGAKYRFWIPANLAYGEQAPPAIGPNQVLDFEVELIEVK